MMAADKFPDYLVQECRNLLAVHCREICMTDRASGESVAGQQLLQEKVFHGSAGYASVLDLMMQGKGAYASMFQRVPIENNREGNESRKDGHMLELLDVFSCDDGSNFIVLQQGFTRDTIAKNKDVKLIGRNISDRAMTAIANYKLALKYHDEYCPNKKLPSGKSFDDLALYVRQKMYVALKGAKSGKSNARRGSGDGKEITEDDMPSRYMFHGYFVYLLYGPLGLAGMTLSCLSVDGTSVPKSGRAAARAKQLDVKAAERSADEGATGMWHRGVTIKDKFSCATLAQSKLKDEKKNVRELLFLNNAAESNCLTALTQTNDMLDKAEARNDSRDIQFLRKRKASLFDELDKLAKRKTELENASNRLMASEHGKQQVNAFYESVGNFPALPFPAISVLKSVNFGGNLRGDDSSSSMSKLSERTPLKEVVDVDKEDDCSPSIQQILCAQAPFLTQTQVNTQEQSNNNEPASVSIAAASAPMGDTVTVCDSSDCAGTTVNSAIDETFTGPAARLSEASCQVLLDFRRKKAEARTYQYGQHGYLNAENAADYYGANDKHE